MTRARLGRSLVVFHVYGGRRRLSWDIHTPKICHAFSFNLFERHMFQGFLPAVDNSRIVERSPSW